jgi:hypothetical protein
MRSAIAALLLGTTMLVAPAHAQDNTQQQATQSSGPADLCHEMLAYAEKTAAGPQKSGGQAQAAASANAPPPRTDGHETGTQGGGSVSGSSSTNTSNQPSAPPTAPVTSGAAPEAASSPHATDNAANAQGATQPGANVPPEAFKLPGGVSLQQVRETAQKGDRQACRDMTQTMRRAGGGLPADLIALAAYEPDPAKRK